MKKLLTDTVKNLLTIGEVGDHFGVQAWRVSELFNRGLLPQPQRVGRSRVVPVEDLPKIEKALKAAGYLPIKKPAVA